MDSLLDDLKHAFHPLAADAGISGEEFDKGFETLWYGASRAALEAAQAESRAIPLYQAVSREEEFPTLFRMHHGVQDILVLEISADLVPIAMAALNFVRELPIETIRFQLARTACELLGNRPERALARFVLFEAVRLNMLVAASAELPTLAYADIDDLQLSRIADDEVTRLIGAQEEVFFEDDHDPIRPLHLVVSAALSRLSDTVDESVAAASVVEHVRTSCDARALAEEALQGIGPLDALLLRNFMAPLLGRQRMSFDRLTATHPLLFADAPNRNTLEKRLSRNKLALSARMPLRRVGKPGQTILDMLANCDEQTQ